MVRNSHRTERSSRAAAISSELIVVIAVVVAVLAVLVLPLAAGAQGADADQQRQRPAQQQQQQQQPPQATQASEQGEVRTIQIYSGQSRIIDAPWPVRRVSVTDPTIADVDVTSPSRVQIQAKAPGATEVVMWSEAEEVWQARVEVEADLSRVQTQLTRLFPGSDLKVSQLGDVIVISGMLPKADQVVQLRNYMELTEQKYLDATSVAGLQQVQLEVKIAEVSRTATRALAGDFLYTDGTTLTAVNNGASGTFQPEDGLGNWQVAFPQSSTSLWGQGTLDGGVVEYFIRALADNQYLRTLAEPTLIAKSGEEASFHVGGEVPIPISEISEGSTNISIEFREYGIRLVFKPIVLGNGVIQLELTPEVSQLTDVGSVEVGGSLIPGFITRRVTTTLELQSGQAFAIAGLLDERDTGFVSKIPALGDLPILGTLFRSVRYQRDETELLVIVRATLVEPTSTALSIPGPGILHEAPSDWELYIDGKTEGKRPKLSSAYEQQLRDMGLDELRGPGTWATYDAQPDRLAGEQR